MARKKVPQSARLSAGRGGPIAIWAMPKWRGRQPIRVFPKGNGHDNNDDYKDDGNDNNDDYDEDNHDNNDDFIGQRRKTSSGAASVQLLLRPGFDLHIVIS